MGSVVHLKDHFEYEPVPTWKNLDSEHPDFSPRVYARRCQGRIKKINRDPVGPTKVELVKCSRDFKREYFRQEGLRENEKSFTVPISQVQPVSPCRGKAGGMNSALDVIDEYLTSSGFFSSEETGMEGTMLFSIFDARHMAQQGWCESSAKQHTSTNLNELFNEYIPHALVSDRGSGVAIFLRIRGL